MNKLSLLAILIGFLQPIVFSQGCLPHGIIFSSQIEIDNFQTMYPGCSEILGDVTIDDIEYQNITNLNGLSSITTIGGNLTIYSNLALTDLLGLQNVSSIGGALEINYNHGLVDLNGLNSLSSINGYLHIGHNNYLSNLNGLNELENIGEYLEIYENGSLVSVLDLSSLSSIGGYILVFSNTELPSLAGFENINKVNGELRIVGNHELSNFTGFNNITSIAGNLDITNNNKLSSLQQLSNLNSIDGRLFIYLNNILISLEGLENINANTINHLFIQQNYLLTICEVTSVCDYLSNPTGPIEILNNSAGCQNKEEVVEACQLVSISDSNIKPEFEIYPNPATKSISISSLCGKNEYDVTIYNHIGQKVLYQTSPDIEIDITELQQGMYIIELSSNNLRVRKKLLIEK